MNSPLTFKSGYRLARFGHFEIDARSGELRKRGVRVKLQDQPFRILLFLTERPGELVTREELRQALWPADTFVDFENGLNTAVAKLRQALLDSAETPRYIETLARRGYRFVAPVQLVRDDRDTALNPAGVSSFPQSSVSPAVVSRSMLQTTPDSHNRHSNITVLAAAVLILIIGALAEWQTRRDSYTSGGIRVTKLTVSGRTTLAAISPDGKYVIYAVQEAGKQSLWLRQSAGVGAAEIVPPAEVVYVGLSFARDGENVYCVRYERERPLLRTLYRVSSLGGDLYRLTEGVDGAIGLSPDGRWFAFVRLDWKSHQTHLMTADADGGHARRLATRPLDSVHGFSWEGPAWSPDGKLIAAGAGCELLSDCVVLVPATGGAEQILLKKNWSRVGQVNWMPDGRSLLTVGQEEDLPNAQLWQVFLNGKLERVTNDINDYVGLSASADGRSLVTVSRSSMSDLTVSRTKNLDSWRRLSSGPSDYKWILGLDWTADGRILFCYRAGASIELRMVRADGEGSRPVPVIGTPTAVAVANDGSVAFSALHSGKLNIWTTKLDEDRPRQLTQTLSNGCPDVSRDGSTIFYSDLANGLWSMSRDGSNRKLLAAHAACFPRLSPDGTRIAYPYLDTQSNKLRLAIMPVSGGGPLQTLDPPWDASFAIKALFQWTPDGRALTYSNTQRDVSNLWTQPLPSGQPWQLTHFTESEIFGFAWSKDGSQLAVSRGRRQSDAVLITRTSGSSAETGELRH